MSFTGNRDVDTIIVSFCDSFTIVNLLSVRRKLVEEAKDKIVEQNIDDPCELAFLITLLRDKEEKELATYFLDQAEKRIENVIDNWEYREILFDGYRPDVLEIYISLQNVNHDKLFNHFLRDTEHLEIDEFYNLLEGFYISAINSKNLPIIKLLMGLWENQLSAYYFDDHDIYSDETRAFVGRINTLDREATQLYYNQ